MPREYSFTSSPERKVLAEREAHVPFIKSRFNPEQPTYRMAQDVYAQTLMKPVTSTGLCHCGNVGLLFGARSDPHCALCRCNEHTPERHGKRTDTLPGCGVFCRVKADMVLPRKGKRLIPDPDDPEKEIDPDDFVPTTVLGRQAWARLKAYLVTGIIPEKGS